MTQTRFNGRWQQASLLIAALVITSGCSVKTYAINMVGDALASGNSVYETDDDLTLVGDALPFGLKLTESLLAQSPRHRGLLLTTSRGFVLYSYAYVDYAASIAADEDLDRARELRGRARRLYLRAFQYGIRGLERSYPGLEAELLKDPRAAVRTIKEKGRTVDMAFMYWTAASLGLAISVSPGDAALLARLPEVTALLDRALEIDEAWQAGALHEFKVVLAGAAPGSADVALIRSHYDRAVELSRGKSASVHLAYAEAVSVPLQNATEFRELVQRALDVNPEDEPSVRLVNLLAHRRAQWLATRIEQLIFDEEAPTAQGRTSR
jgi:predicted anti-sigma-YlaC factor YlaD